MSRFVTEFLALIVFVPTVMLISKKILELIHKAISVTHAYMDFLDVFPVQIWLKHHVDLGIVCIAVISPIVLLDDFTHWQCVHTIYHRP